MKSEHHRTSSTVMAAITTLVLVALLMTTLTGCLADQDEIDKHPSVVEEVLSDMETNAETWKLFDETVLTSSSRQRRALRQIKVIEILETQRNLVANLGNDYTERFSFKAPAPRQFTINPVMGAIHVRDGQKLDFETEPEINFTVLITKVDNTKYGDELPVRIRLGDVNDEVPQFQNTPRPFLAMVSSDAPIGTSVYQLMAQDGDRNNKIHYTLESGGSDCFEVDSETGVVRTTCSATSGTRSLKPGREYEIGVSAVDLNGESAPLPQKSATHSLKILVGDRDPQFYELLYKAGVPEHAPKQFEVIRVKALSHLGFPITYELTTDSGAQSNDFAVDQRTGVVDLLHTLDYETDPVEYHLKIKAIENRRVPVTSTVNLVVNVIDVNDNVPTFPLSQYIVQNIAETVPVGTDIIQVMAADADSVTNSQLTYNVTDGNFTVQTINNVGYIRTARRLDYDYLPDHTYNFTVIAIDNGVPALTGSANVRVSVTNVNDEDPVFAQSSIEYVQVSEDALPSTVIHVLQAYDPDGDGVSYSFAGNQLNYGPFSIERTSGIITLVGSLEKSRGSYRLDVVVTDDGRCCGSTISRTRRGTVIVEVRDINNNAPKFPDCASYGPVVMEKENVGISVIQVRAIDLDIGANGNITYSLVKSTDQGIERFQIDPVSGLIRTADVFDREAKIGVTDFGVTVKAEDHGSPILAGFCTFRVKIGDRNDNPPVFNLHEYSASIEESSPINHRIKQVYATDRDAGENARVRYELRRDPSGFFAINPNNGWVTVARSMTGQRKVQLAIVARDHGDPPRSAEVLMDIEITQTTNEYPRWVNDYSGAPPIRFSENAAVNYEVGRFRAISTVPDASLNYFIARGDTPDQNGEPISFYSRIDETTNEMILLTYRPLDYEAISRYTLTIKAANRAVNPLHIDMQLNIELIDENDEIPQFVGLDENGRYPGSIAENLKPGAEVITVTATDKDQLPAFKKITYRLKEVGEDYRKFVINSESGAVRTTASFDRELKNEYYITVVAEDGAPSNRSNHYPAGTPNRGEAEIQVRVTDMNDNAPFFRERVYKARVPENTDIGAIVMTVTAEDLDEENGLTYSITSGNVGNAFEVVPDLGEIKVRRHLDYEAGQREYRMTYRVFDDKFENVTTLVVQVLDVNDNPPQFDNAIYTVHDLNEEESGISKSSPKYLLTVRATDPDVDRRSTIRYAVTGQFADDGTFIINAHTGEIYVTRALDRDSPRGRPVWNFNILAHDEAGGNGPSGSGQPSLTGYSEVRVMPRDVNDNAPVFDKNRLIGRVLEHSRAGVTVLTVIATDADTGNNGTVTYSLLRVPHRDNQRLFAIDANNGLVTSVHTNAFDREREAEYQLIIEARDRGVPQRSATATVTIIIDDINDNSPVFTQRVYRAVMSENYAVGTSVISVSATDVDIGSNAKLMYSLKQHDREYFTIATVEATNSGVLKVHKTIDYDSLLNPSFNLTVYVEDADTSHVDTAYIEVQVTDYNDNAPVFNPNQHRVVAFENVSIATTLYKFTVSDRDTGINKQFSFSIDWNTDPEHKFSINSNGLVTTAKMLDRETKSEHRIHILAIDKGNPSLTGTGTLFVTLNDVNDNAPQFASDYRPVVYENQPRGQNIITISAIDRDTASNGPPFEFWLPCHGGCPCADNPTCADFGFQFIPKGGSNGHGGGVVTSLRTFDREKQKEYYVPIVMRDRGSPSVTGTNTLTVIIGDVNDNQHYGAHKEISVYNYKGMFENVFLGNVYAADEDDWDVTDKSFTFASDEYNHLFRLDQESGKLYTVGRIDTGIYRVKVKIYDSLWRHEVVSTVTVNVKNIPEEAVFNSGSIRLSGITAEEFIAATKPGQAVVDKTKYDRLKELIATRLNIVVENVDIFTVLNHPTLSRTIDVRYSAHGSPYYQPSRLDGILSLNKTKIEEELGLVVLMVPIDECHENPMCAAAPGCTSELVVNDKKSLLVNANATALIGVMSYMQPLCQCKSRMFNLNGTKRHCNSQTCLNGGTCQQLENTIQCQCLFGFDGPRCQQTRHTFNGYDSWAFYPPLAMCGSSHMSLELITLQDNGIILYNGPLGEQTASQAKDFILLELKNGFPILRIDHGSGELKLALDGRGRDGEQRVDKLSDGKWHRIDILQTGKQVRLIIDRCRAAKITETDRTSSEDRRSCEAVGLTPGDLEVLNVISPLQLGGRLQPSVHHPGYSGKDGFKGCIKNLFHNSQLYDLHIGQVGEHRNSEDSCVQEDSVCNIKRHSTHCGVNGECIGDFHRNYQCNCRPGWRGSKCSIPTTSKDLQERSFMEWNFKNDYYNKMLAHPQRTEWQLMFRTRQSSAMLLKAQNHQRSKQMVLEVVDGRVHFRYNLGRNVADTGITLTHVNVSDGEWHVVHVERVGHWTSIHLDFSDGPYINESFSPVIGGQFEFRIAQHSLIAGGDVRFPSANGVPVVSYDFSNGCMNDIRIDGGWLPMNLSQNKESEVAEFTARSQNVMDGCSSNACINSAARCARGLVCFDLWRLAECRCPYGHRLVRLKDKGASACEPINECTELSDPCNGGHCVDSTHGYVCDCVTGRSGPTCAERRGHQVAAAYINTGALLIIVASFVLLLIMILTMAACIHRYSKPRYVGAAIYPDDDVRENIIHYDEEGVGEQDQSAYDISQLKKPLGAPRCKQSPAVEKVMFPSSATWERPRKTVPLLGDGECDIADYIKSRLRDADTDPTCPPFESVRVYAYEGDGSTAGSLSSVYSKSDVNDDDQYDGENSSHWEIPSSRVESLHDSSKHS